MSFEKSSRRFLKSVCGTRMLLFMAALAGMVFLSVSGISNAQLPSKAQQLSSKAGEAYIKVTSPGRNEVWEKGKTYTIRWESKGIRGNVKIMLLAGGPRPALKVSEAKAFEITRNINNSGSYSYLVPDNLPDGMYKVQIMTIDESIKGAGEGTVAIRGQKTAVAKVASQQDHAKVAPAGKRGAKTGVEPSGKTAVDKTSQGAAAASAGATVATGKTASTTATPAKGATPYVAAAGKNQTAAAKIVRQDITSAKVSEAKLNNFKFQTSTVSAPDYKIGGHSAAAVKIEVYSPRDGDIWEAEKEYNIRWQNTGFTGDVRITLDFGLVAGGKHTEYLIAERAANTGSYLFRVPRNWLRNPNYWRIRICTLDGIAAGFSPGTIKVYTQYIDLQCEIVDPSIWEKNVWGNEKRWFEFNVWWRNKGTRFVKQIYPVLVRIIKEPEEMVCYQEEWGVGEVYPFTWYELPDPRRFDIETWKHFFVDYNRHVDLEKGAYRVEVELDPHNYLGEDEQLRDDNKAVVRWSIK